MEVDGEVSLEGEEDGADVGVALGSGDGGGGGPSRLIGGTLPVQDWLNGRGRRDVRAVEERTFVARGVEECL